MLVIHGTRRFGLKILERKVVECRTCERGTPCRWEQSFDWLHIFWVPVFPLGTTRTWVCDACGNDPQARTKTKLGVKVLLLVVLLPFLLAVCLVPEAEIPTADRRTLQVGRIIFAIAYGWYAASVIREAKSGKKQADPETTTEDYCLPDYAVLEAAGTLPVSGLVAGMLHVDFKNVFPYVAWVSKPIVLRASSEVIVQKYLSVRHAEQDIVQVVGFCQLADGVKQVFGQYTVGVGGFQQVEGMVNDFAARCPASFTRWDFSSARTVEEFADLLMGCRRPPSSGGGPPPLPGSKPVPGRPPISIPFLVEISSDQANDSPQPPPLPKPATPTP